MNTDLEKAIEEKRYINFDYRNANGERSSQRVEPLAIHYKWYAWYLFAYVPAKGDYRTYKIARIQNLKTEQTISTDEHGNIEQLMLDSEQAYYSTSIHIEVRFAKEESGLMEEYFPDCPIEKVSDEECRIYIDVPAKERLWKALLLSFGDKVRVVAPESYRDELICTAKSFLSNYDI